MTDAELKTGVEPLPSGGRIFGNTDDLQGYRKTLRHARALVQLPGEVQETPNWGKEIEEGSRPLFEVLGPDVAAPIDPAEALNRIRDEAKQEGYSAGIQEAKQTVESIIARYQEAILNLEMVRDEILAETETDVVNLALLIAREAVRNESEARVRFTEKMTAHCLGQLRNADKITLRVNATDFETVREKHPEFISEETVVRLVEDPSLALGGVIAECSLGRIDASFDRRITDIAQQLLDEDAVIRPALERELTAESTIQAGPIEQLDGSSDLGGRHPAEPEETKETKETLEVNEAQNALEVDPVEAAAEAKMMADAGMLDDVEEPKGAEVTTDEAVEAQGLKEEDSDGIE